MSLKKHSLRTSGASAQPLPLRIASSKPKTAAQPVVFCDFDGPIVDVSERYYQTYRQGLTAISQQVWRESGEELNLQPLSKQRFWDMKQNRVADIEIATRSGLPESLFPAFMQHVIEIVNHPSLLLWDKVQPTAREALEYFQQCDFRVVIVTLRHPRQVNDFLHAQGLAHLIADVYGAADINAAYANRVEQKCELLGDAIAQQTLKGHYTTDSWMIGDTEADIIAGQTFNLATAALSCGVRSQNYLSRFSPKKLHCSLLQSAHEVVNSAALQVA